MRDLQRHKTTVHEGIRPYKCETCQRDFKLKHQLNSHKLLCESFQCYTCFEKFSSKRDLKNHTTSFHSTKKIFTCFICFDKFTRNFTLKAHMKKFHEESKTDECSFENILKEENENHDKIEDFKEKIAKDCDSDLRIKEEFESDFQVKEEILDSEQSVYLSSNPEISINRSKSNESIDPLAV